MKFYGASLRDSHLTLNDYCTSDALNIFTTHWKMRINRAELRFDSSVHFFQARIKTIESILESFQFSRYIIDRVIQKLICAMTLCPSVRSRLSYMKLQCYSRPNPCEPPNNFWSLWGWRVNITEKFQCTVTIENILIGTLRFCGKWNSPNHIKTLVAHFTTDRPSAAISIERGWNCRWIMKKWWNGKRALGSTAGICLIHNGFGAAP